jgi:hypothetical protein
MSDQRGHAGAPIFTVSRDGACDDAALLQPWLSWQPSPC